MWSRSNRSAQTIGMTVEYVDRMLALRRWSAATMGVKLVTKSVREHASELGNTTAGSTLVTRAAWQGRRMLENPHVAFTGATYLRSLANDLPSHPSVRPEVLIRAGVQSLCAHKDELHWAASVHVLQHGLLAMESPALAWEKWTAATISVFWLHQAPNIRLLGEHLRDVRRSLFFRHVSTLVNSSHSCAMLPDLSFERAWKTASAQAQSSTKTALLKVSRHAGLSDSKTNSGRALIRQRLEAFSAGLAMPVVLPLRECVR